VNQPQERSDYSSLNDRMSYLFAIRIAVAVVTLVYGIARPEALGVPFSTVVTVALAYVATSVVFEAVRRRTTRFGYSLITVMLLIDGAFLAAAMYVTGGTQSPFRFFIYLHLVAVSLLASYRTGLKIALWHSLLLFVVLYAQAAHLLPPVDVVPGREIEFERMPILSVTSFWLFALATSVFSAINERELRQRRADLQAMVDIGARLDEARDPVVQSRIVLDGLIERFGFVRGLILGASDGQVLVLAAHGIGALPTTRLDTDAIVNRAWEQRRPLPVRPRLPDDRRRAVGRRDRPRAWSSSDAGHRASGRVGRRAAGIHRRTQSAQCRAAPPRPGPRRARRADGCRQPAHVPAQPRTHPRS
jgi:hypothetical protein